MSFQTQGKFSDTQGKLRENSGKLIFKNLQTPWLETLYDIKKFNNNITLNFKISNNRKAKLLSSEF